MRRGFEGAMRDYGEIAKDEQEAKKKAFDAKHTELAEQAQRGVERVAEVLAWHVEKRAGRAATSEETQKEVYVLQQKKQKVMDRLHADLAVLGEDRERAQSGERRRKGARAVEGRGDALICRRPDGVEYEVTVGEMVTDGAWGIQYDADPETVPRVVRKRLVVERAKREIQELLDRQIVAEETGSRRVHEKLKLAYEGFAEGHGDAEPRGIGTIAEQMTAQLVRKRILDGDAPYRFEQGDAYDDVARKIDFVLRRNDYGRGVRVEDAELGAKAVQLTVNRDPQKLAHKRSQLERTRSMLQEDDHIDDIALVQFDQKAVSSAWDAWQKAGRPPGGPDKFLPDEVRERMFDQLVEGMG